MFQNYSGFYSLSHMDILMAYQLQEKMKYELQEKKLQETKLQETNKNIIKEKKYISPKRDNVCCKCGQQYHWCVCEYS
jgi:hypothetical protein